MGEESEKFALQWILNKGLKVYSFQLQGPEGVESEVNGKRPLHSDFLWLHCHYLLS